MCKQRQTENRHQLWGFQYYNWLGRVLLLLLLLLLQRGLWNASSEHRRGAIIVVVGRWLLTCAEYCLWIKLQKSRWSQGWWKAGLIMDMAETFCELLSCLKQLISMVMRVCKYNSSMRDGFWSDKMEQMPATPSFNCYLTGSPQSEGRNIFHEQVRNKKINEISLNWQGSIREAFCMGKSEQQIWLEVVAWEEGGLRKEKRLI